MLFVCFGLMAAILLCVFYYVSGFYPKNTDFLRIFRKTFHKTWIIFPSLATVINIRISNIRTVLYNFNFENKLICLKSTTIIQFTINLECNIIKYYFVAAR